jgi:hypothetical protein
LARAGLALLIAVSLLGAPGAAKPAAAAGAGWYDGLIQYSTITNCVSIIQGAPYLEYGAGAYVGFDANPDSLQPTPNTTYYVHVVVYGLGNACSGQRFVPELVLPSGTSPALTTTDRVRCFTHLGEDTANCPQALAAGSNGGYRILAPTSEPARTWPLPQGGYWEFLVPVRSTTALSGSQLRAHVVMADGNANPTLLPTQGVYVFQAGVPSIAYPGPSTTGITRTAALSTAHLYSGGLAGNAYFELRTTSSTSGTPVFTDGPAVIPLGSNYSVWSDWTPYALQPDTTYYWRLRFQATGGGTTYGAVQTFRTLGAAAGFGVTGLVGGQTGGFAQSVTVTAKDATNTTATGYRGTVQFSSTDANAALPADYTFTATDNGSHTFSLRLMTAGTQSVTIRDKATSAITGTQGGISVTTTVTPPTASVTAQPAWRASLSVPLAWNGGNGAANYDVRYRKAAYNGAFGSPVTYKSATTAKSATFAGAVGTTYCFSVRSRAASGAVSAWTSETCTAVPLDERSMTKSGTWTAGTGSAYFKSTYLRSTAKGAKLVRTAAQAKRIAIVATTCSTCGKVSVYWGSTLLKTVSLVSTTTRNKRLITIAAFPEVRSGTITLKVYTSGKKVLIDGLVISKN